MATYYPQNEREERIAEGKPQLCRICGCPLVCHCEGIDHPHGCGKLHHEFVACMDCTTCEDTGVKVWNDAYCDCSRGAALCRAESQSAAAVDPHATSQLSPSTRDKEE